jgi:hypothetical protein
MILGEEYSGDKRKKSLPRIVCVWFCFILPVAIHSRIPVNNIFSLHGTTEQIGSGPPCLLMFLDNKHIHTVGLFWTSDKLVAEAATYTTHNKKQETNIHAPCGIRTRNPSINQAAAELSLRPHGHRDQAVSNMPDQFIPKAILIYYRSKKNYQHQLFLSKERSWQFHFLLKAPIRTAGCAVAVASVLSLVASVCATSVDISWCRLCSLCLLRIRSLTRPANCVCRKAVSVKKLLLSARIISTAFILQCPQIVLVSLQCPMK